MKTYKSYTMPCGEIRRVQGYEPFALDDLLKIYNENEIITSRKYIPKFEYLLNNNKHYYFPDIYIPKDNKIIEVKSDFTITLNPNIIILKKDACIASGYFYEIWVYNSKVLKDV
jgi:hypothetical protein